MRKAIQQGSAKEKVRKHRDGMTADWNPTCQCLVNYDPSMVTSLQHVSWMDQERFRETCSIKEKGKRGGIFQPFYGSWVVDFMLRQDAEMLGKYLNDKNSFEAKESSGNGCGNNYANSQSPNPNRQEVAVNN